MYNYGQYTRPGTLSNVADFVWKGLGHMFEFGPLLAAEVTDINGNTVHILDDGLWLPGQGGYAPDLLNGDGFPGLGTRTVSKNS